MSRLSQACAKLVSTCSSKFSVLPSVARTGPAHTTSRILPGRWQSTAVPAMQQISWRPSSNYALAGNATMNWQDSPQVRQYSSRRKKDTSGPLANEKLIKVLMKKNSKARGPQDVEVRLVIDEGHDTPATVQVCSLADAISLSVERLTDLVGTSLNSDPPVIRAAQLSKLEYQKEQASLKQKVAAKSKQRKAFRFRAGIDLHDLERKIEDMTRFLQKGTECEYTVFSKARTLRSNPNAGMDLVDRIQELVSDYAVMKRAPHKNEAGNHIRVALEPKKV